jgi:hypothetical protein
MVRVAPQRSVAVIDPHAALAALHSSCALSGSQPQTFEAPHAIPVSHVPHAAVRVTPQLSASVTSPQLAPRRAQNEVSLSATHAGGDASGAGGAMPASGPDEGGGGEAVGDAQPAISAQITTRIRFMPPPTAARGFRPRDRTGARNHGGCCRLRTSGFPAPVGFSAGPTAFISPGAAIEQPVPLARSMQPAPPHQE